MKTNKWKEVKDKDLRFHANGLMKLLCFMEMDSY